MFGNLRIAFTILLAIKIVLVSSSVISSNQIDHHLCSNNNTIAVQIMTARNGDVSCQCQVGLEQNSVIREDYVYTPGVGSHKLHTVAKTWNEARKICNEENGHLAIINSKSEESILMSMLQKAEKSIKYAVSTEVAYLGIHDMYEEGNWVTIFGQSLYSTGYSAWSSTYWSGQPDNNGGNQNCGAVIRIGGMDDVNCKDKFAFFCELPLTCYTERNVCIKFKENVKDDYSEEVN